MFRKKPIPKSAQVSRKKFDDNFDPSILCDDPYLVNLIQKLEQAHREEKKPKNN